MTGTKTYYPAAGAMRVNSTLYFVLKDHLGSASVVTDANGLVITNGEQRYDPFGKARLSPSNMLTDKLFTGQREMADLRIYHYGARFYSPYINRFLSADTIVPDYANPQSLNRYAYVLNNPLRYTDPTGHCVEADFGVCMSVKQVTKREKAEKLKTKNKNNDGQNNSIPFATNTPTTTPTATTTATLTPVCSNPSNLCTTIVAGQATSLAFQTSTPTAGFHIGQAPPLATATNTPNNVLATAGAKLDIAANTAIPGAFIENCVKPSFGQGCGRTLEQAIPQLEPLGTMFDGGAYGGSEFVDKVGESRPSITNGTIYTSIAIPTSLIPLLLFALGL